MRGSKAPPPVQPQASKKGVGGAIPGAVREEDPMPVDDYDMPTMIYVKPEDQLDLTAEQLEKEVPPRVLYPVNPRAPANISKFSYKDRQYKQDPEVEQSVFHFAMD